MVEVWRGNRRVGHISHVTEKDIAGSGGWRFALPSDPMGRGDGPEEVWLPAGRRAVMQRGDLGFRVWKGEPDWQYSWWVLEADGVSNEVLRQILTTKVEGALDDTTSA